MKFMKLDTHNHSKMTIVNVAHLVSVWVDYTGKTHVKLSDGTTINTTTPFNDIEKALMGKEEA